MEQNIIRDEMHELMDLVAKYSQEQLANMLLALDLSTLHKNMIERGATREELRTVSETYHDVMTVYGYI
jgi:hypothetical protein